MANYASRAYADTEAAVGGGRSCGAGARGFSNIEGIASGVQQAERVRAIGETEEANNNGAAVCGTGDGAACRRFRVRHRVRRTAWQDPHSMEGDHGIGSG